MQSILYGLYPWLFGLITLATLLLAFEAGFRVGRARAGHGPSDRGQTSTVQAAILAFLALLLAFSFSLSQTRFDTRRRLVVTEANAIETTYLRAQMLPSPLRERASRLLREYVLNRTPPVDRQAIEVAVARSEQLQEALWEVAEQVSRKVDNPAVVILFTESLNETIDLHSVRVAAFLYSAPPGLLLLLCGTAALALGVAGFAAGLEKRRNLLVMFALALFVSTVFALLLDLEHPARGLFLGSDRPLLEVQRHIGAR